MSSEKHFIVVDDDPTNNIICKFAIMRAFPTAEVELFTEPQKALDEIKQKDPAKRKRTILFLDINMPLITGWDFLEIFKDMDAGIIEQYTIFILSSSIDERDKERANSNPLVAGFLSKPLTTTIIKTLGLSEE